MGPARRFGGGFGGRARGAGPSDAAEASEAPPVAVLRARAIGWLARREHSRMELQAKLRRLGGGEAAVAEVIEHLEREKLLSDERFAASVARVRSSRYGSQRIAVELRRKGVGAEVEGLIDDLKASDTERARAIWARKFGVPPTDPADAARQMRFLQARGFPTDVIRRVVPACGAVIDEA
jgi:regulatory protein